MEWKQFEMVFCTNDIPIAITFEIKEIEQWGLKQCKRIELIFKTIMYFLKIDADLLEKFKDIQTC